jgi:NADH dehydrogenase
MPHKMSSVFITGASGFIGRTLLGRLRSRRYDPIYCLTRNESAAGLADDASVKWLIGSIFDSAVYGSYLESSDTVVHLAATTGKTRREEYLRVNAAGTRYLLAECKPRGVKNFLYVSSIAVKYGDKSHYDYAQSKQQGEEAVAQSGLHYTIVRPTIVLGKESPGWQALSKLARLPLVVVFGDGRARIQPVDINDLADALVTILEEQRFSNETLDLGGPDVVSIEEFLQQVHRRYYRGQAKAIHLPVKPLASLLAFTDRYLPWLMPLNAGQLSALVQDGTAASNPLYEKQRSRMKNLETMLKTLTS